MTLSRTGLLRTKLRSVPLFWLNYCHPDGRFDRFAGVVVVESYTHLHASMKAEVSGADRGLDFAGAHELDAKTARQVLADISAGCSMTTIFASCNRPSCPKKPVSPTVRGRPVPKRSVGKR